jgi:hypothetical protein
MLLYISRAEIHIIESTAGVLITFGVDDLLARGKI